MESQLVKNMSKSLRRQVSHAYGIAMRLGIVPYKRIRERTQADWDEEYSSGELSYYEGLPELSRFSLIIGYLDFFEGCSSVLDVGCGTGALASADLSMQERSDRIARLVEVER